MNFRDQIIEDIRLTQSEFADIDPRMKKDEFAFNHWVLDKLYNIDNEIAFSNIVENQDKGIGCFVHYEDSKELYLIQNKFYDKETRIVRNDFSDFLSSPIAILDKGSYNRSPELQRIYNNIKDDSDYRIYWHFYITNDLISCDIKTIAKEFNKNNNYRKKCEIFDINDIKTLYFGKTFKDDQNFEYSLDTINKGTILRINPKEYNMPRMSKAYYIATPITTLYKMFKHSEEENYPIFEANIREYLGRSSINKGIINTLKNENERHDFFYYNNGITIICDDAKDCSESAKRICKMTKPQIVNGCQTVSSINDVLSDFSENEIQDKFGDVYVMVKVLVMKDKSDEFYKKVVKYTNSQNSISEKHFGASHDLFLSLQDHFLERGFLLIVKPSDKEKFKKEYSTSIKLGKLLKKANNFIKINKVDKITDLYIPLDRFLQTVISLVQDGFIAYSKKSQILQPNTELYKEMSLNVQERLTVDNMLRLYNIYSRAEFDKKNSNDKKTPIPYYVVSFLSHFIDKNQKDSFNKLIEGLYGCDNVEFENIYTNLCVLTTRYRKYFAENNKIEYNAMIKTQINWEVVDKEFSALNDFSPEGISALGKFIKNINKN